MAVGVIESTTEVNFEEERQEEQSSKPFNKVFIPLGALNLILHVLNYI